MPVALRIGRRRSSLSLPTGVTTYDALSMESPDIQTPLISLKEGTDINVMLCYAAELHEVDAYLRCYQAHCGVVDMLPSSYTRPPCLCSERSGRIRAAPRKMQSKQTWDDC